MFIVFGLWMGCVVVEVFDFDVNMLIGGWFGLCVE